MAITDQSEKADKAPSLVLQIALLLALTVAAAGIGWFAGNYLNPGSKASAGAERGAAAGHEGSKDKAPDGEYVQSKPLIIPLAPITTNLAGPSEVWIRLEASILVDHTPGDIHLAEKIHQDLLAFMRTLKLHQVEGASGFQHLKADLEERAAIRSGGLVKAVLIRTLLFE